MEAFLAILTQIGPYIAPVLVWLFNHKLPISPLAPSPTPAPSPAPGPAPILPGDRPLLNLLLQLLQGGFKPAQAQTEAMPGGGDGAEPVLHGAQPMTFIVYPPEIRSQG